jgi:hypothetical protein
MISRVRKIPVGHNPEDVMRDLVGDRDVVWNNHEEVMQYLYDTLEENPDIGGIIGYSEGAAIAATFILDEQRRQQETGRERRINCAMFVTGWPPIDPHKGVILADQDDDLIDVPTLHVVGANGMDEPRTRMFQSPNSVRDSLLMGFYPCFSLKQIPSDMVHMRYTTYATLIQPPSSTRARATPFRDPDW